MNFETGAVSGKALSIMDWGVNNAFKNLKDMEPKGMMDVALISSIDPVDVGLGSSEKVNAALSIKPRKKTMTSIYLKYFETAPDGKSRKCKFCGQSYSIATATGNLGRHLSNRHPGYDNSGDAVVTTSTQQVTIAKKAQAKSPHFVLDHLNWLLIKWLILSSLPPSTLEEKWLVNSFKYLNPAIQLWPGEKYQTILCDIFTSMQDDVRVVLDQVSSKVTIALDFWTSYEQIFYMSVRCQWIDENWSVQNILIDVCHIPFPCDSTEIYTKLACHTLKEEIDCQKVSPFCYIPCGARILNSIISDGLRTLKSVVSKIREFVLKINTSMEISQDFIELTAAFQEGNWKIPLDTSVRWSGNHQMLDVVRKAGKAMDSIIRKYEETLGGRLLLSPAEKIAVNVMYTFLEPFHKTINNICTNKFPTVGLVLFFMDHISETIATCRDSRHNPEWLKNAAEEMAAKAQDYNDQVCNIFTYMTAILDPRIKVELISESLNSENHLEEARSHFMRNYSSNHFPSMTNAYMVQESQDGGTVSFAEEIARKKRRASMSSVTDELTQYLSEAPAALQTDVLDWWKANSTRYPRLSLMARDFLAVQATSIAPEDIFWSKGDEIDKQRFTMPFKTTQALLCIKSWTEVGMKLKHKSTVIDYNSLMELAATAARDNVSVAYDRKPN
ncbi:zinc finger BED domain-containing protein DAYSLEEPER isoform X3 [Daucus carota subsp. sativus]|uniref:zinc finger BED domain-containing protein DAYSLEEPER isoform X3 n=1 Tax=Daucus carota subsp. sativus TaxID=79200 RepID=UPI0007F029C8|nr:PREDICTED: zinc finger BED domain-containing protein DAYSLEEPER isoform X3 [Daucus carota subsp. sativus]